MFADSPGLQLELRNEVKTIFVQYSSDEEQLQDT